MPPRLRAVTISIVAGLCVAGPAVVAGAASAKAPTFYVDCAHGSNRASGTSPARPFKTPARAAAARLRPGSAVLFKRSTRCRGVFAPKRSGTRGKPIVAGAYGTGSRPVIDGGGARAAIVLRDVQGWTVRDLAIRNPGSVATVGVLRSAIQIDVATLSTASGFTIRDNVITDVATSKVAPEGENAINYGKDSGGILLTATGTSVLSDVRITGNRLDHVGREGIVVRGGGPTRRLVISGNRLHDIQGDGIVAVRASGGLIERNVLDGFNTRGKISNAGMWAYHSTGVTFQHNEVSHGANGDLDGSAFDIDGGNEGLVFQYNLSHDNAGGFLMMCGDQGTQSGNSTVRYNVSQDDHLSEQGVIRAPACGNEQNIRIYNNTIFTRDAGAGYLVRNVNGSDLIVNNNLFVATRPTPVEIKDVWSRWDNNLYAGVTCDLGLLPDRNAVLADPGLAAPGTARSLTTATGYRLRQGSPALGAGTVMPANGGRDFFGNPVPAAAKPNLGAYQGPGVGPRLPAVTPRSAPGCAPPA